MIYVLASLPRPHEFGDDVPVKIGTAVDIFKRMKQLSTGTYFDIVCISCFAGGRSKEAEIHKKFRKKESPYSGEWFFLNPEELVGLISKSELSSWNGVAEVPVPFQKNGRHYHTGHADKELGFHYGSALFGRLVQDELSKPWSYEKTLWQILDENHDDVRPVLGELEHMRFTGEGMIFP